MNFENNITVLLCVHSQDEFHDILLDRALDSLVQQTFKDFKLLVVADSCHKETAIVFEKYRNLLDMRIERHEKSGLAKAKNFGLKHIHTDWVCMQDADDIAMPEKLEKQIEYFKANPETDILSTHYYFLHNKIYYNGEGKLIVEPPFIFPFERTQFNITKSCFEDIQYLTDAEIKARLPLENVLCHGSVMMKRSIFEKVQYNTEEKHRSCEDWSLWHDCMKLGFKMAQTKERLYCYSLNTSVPR